MLYRTIFVLVDNSFFRFFDSVCASAFFFYFGKKMYIETEEVEWNHTYREQKSLITHRVGSEFCVCLTPNARHIDWTYDIVAIFFWCIPDLYYECNNFFFFLVVSLEFIVIPDKYPQIKFTFSVWSTTNMEDETQRNREFTHLRFKISIDSNFFPSSSCYTS